MADQEQDIGERPLHREGGEIIFNAPQDEKEAARQRREHEQHEFARAQVKTNSRIAWFTGALVLATFCTIGVGIWQGEISQTAANAAKKAADAAEQSVGLTRAQLMATQGPLVYFTPMILNRHLVVNFVSVSGRNAAIGFHFTLVAQRMSLPDRKPIGAPSQECHFDKPFLLGNDSQDCPITILQGARDEMMHTRQTLRVTGIVKYQDGFGDTIERQYCDAFIGYQLVQRRADNTASNAQSDKFVDCADFEDAMRVASNLRKDYNDIYVPPAPVVPLPPPPSSR